VNSDGYSTGEQTWAAQVYITPGLALLQRVVRQTSAGDTWFDYIRGEKFATVCDKLFSISRCFTQLTLFPETSRRSFIHAVSRGKTAF
jgi:hypothetical protein